MVPDFHYRKTIFLNVFYDFRWKILTRAEQFLSCIDLCLQGGCWHRGANSNKTFWRCEK